MVEGWTILGESGVSAAAMLLIALATFIASFLFTWAVRGIMRRSRIFDVPADRKAHAAPVAYEGGVAMYLALIVGTVLAAITVPSLFFMNQQIQGLVLGATLTVAVGVADDLMDLRPILKLMLQIAIAGMMCYFGFRIERISNPFGGEALLPAAVSITGTIIWYALLMNGINMIDGLDGLAAGIVGLTGVTLFAIAVNMGQPFSAVLSILLAAVCAGFLPFNFKPASIFMGDAGSLLLGFLLASITLLSSTKAPALLALLIPVLAVGLPVFETVFAFVRRIIRGQHPFRGDRRHLHHRFMALGLSERRTVLTFYYMTAYLGVTAFILQRLEARLTLVLVAVIGLGMLLLVENMRYLERVDKKEKK